MFNKRLCIVHITIVLAGCASQNKSLLEVKDIEDFPEKRTTIMSDSLSCLGKMANFYGKPKKIVTVPNILDRTGVSEASDREIPSNLTDMVVTELTKVGGPLRVNYYPNSEESSTFNQLLSVSGFKPKALMPDKSYAPGTIILQGALTEYDRLLLNRKSNNSEGFSFGAGKGETAIDYSQDDVETVGRMTMDFRVVQSTVGEVEHGTASSNTIKINQDSKTTKFSLSIYGNSFSDATSISEVDARHSALRLLSQYGIAETLGKHWMVPYWKCTGVKRKEDVKLVSAALRSSILNEDVVSFFKGMKTSDKVNSNPKVDRFFVNTNLFSIGSSDPSQKEKISIGGKSYEVSQEDLAKKETEVCNELRSKYKLSLKNSNCDHEPYPVVSQETKFMKLYSIYKKLDKNKSKIDLEKFNLDDVISDMRRIYKESTGKELQMPKTDDISEIYARLWLDAPFSEEKE